ncbi:hypothetical protein MPSEU_001021200 [Mayamaea pseudoterrestris]|nr:hypothetical protein MPSEU_001021200 [Mayamaea pseudoterrestris]
MNGKIEDDDADFADAEMTNGANLHSPNSNQQQPEQSLYKSDSNDMGDEPFDEEMSDVPIDTADHGSSLPSPEELRHSLPQHRKGKFKYFCIAIVVALVVIACISLGAGVSNKKQQAKVNEPPPRQASLSQVIKYIAATGVSSKEDLQLGGSPQSLAANWIANIDGMNMALPSDKDGSSSEGYKYITRYVSGLLWYALNGADWKNQYGFLSQNDICFWNAPLPVMTTTGVDFQANGIYCDRETKEVTAVRLGYNKLTGSIPSEVTKLTTLTQLDVSGNKMRGSVGANVCKLKRLKALIVNYGGFIGTLPPCLSTLTDLEVLMTSNNYLGGRLPDLSKLTKLASVFLDDNKLTGTITTTFNKMTNLKFLFMQGNNFYGNIDDEFLKNAKNLSRLDMSNGNYTGQLPSHFFGMPNLQLLDLHGNRLSGSFPSNINKNTALQYISLQENLIKGPLHPSLVNLTRLFHLDVSNNTLTGPIPGRIGMLPLEYLFLANNKFAKGPIPPLFGLMTNITELSLKGTNRNGTIPAWLGTNMTKLKLLDLDNNSLNGNIPSELGRLTYLEFLLLNRNLGIKGALPSQMNKLSSLRSIFLDNTGLSGSLEPICKLQSLNAPETSGNLTRDFISADCGGNNPKVKCSCCDVCCSNTNPKCNQNYQVASIDPNWESSFQRASYSLGTDDANFENRVTERVP